MGYQPKPYEEKATRQCMWKCLDVNLNDSCFVPLSTLFTLMLGLFFIKLAHLTDTFRFYACVFTSRVIIFCGIKKSPWWSPLNIRAIMANKITQKPYDSMVISWIQLKKKTYRDFSSQVTLREKLIWIYQF